MITPYNTKRSKAHTQSGKPLTKEEFTQLVKESGKSGYMSDQQFKEKCKELRRTNHDS